MKPLSPIEQMLLDDIANGRALGCSLPNDPSMIDRTLKNLVLRRMVVRNRGRGFQAICTITDRGREAANDEPKKE